MSNYLAYDVCKPFNKEVNMYKVLYTVEEVNRAIGLLKKNSLSTFTLISKLYFNSISYLLNVSLYLYVVYKHFLS